MSADPLLTTAGVSIAAGVGCQLLARRMRLPPILPLLLTGIALGPSGLGIVQPESLGEGLRIVVGFAVAIILFEGGLSLSLDALKSQRKAIQGLVTIGATLTWILAAVLAWLLFDGYGAREGSPGFDWRAAMLFGALVIVTGPTVIQPLLRTVRPRESVADTLRGEAIIVDPIGALAAVLALEIDIALSGAESHPAIHLTWRLTVGFLLGAVAALATAAALRNKELVPPDLRNLTVLVTALASYAVSETVIHESGVLTVTVAGLLLGWMHPPGIEEIEEFKVQLTALMVSLVFILLAAGVSMVEMAQLGWKGVALVAGIIFIVRPASALPAMIGSELTWRERLFICWISPRGIIAASVSALFALLLVDVGQGPEGMVVRDMVFAVILGTVLLQAPTAGMVARWLGVTEEHPRGVVIMGADKVGRRIGSMLWEHGVKVLVVDTNRDKVRLAREAGLPAKAVNLLDPYAADELNLAGMGLLLAMTTNDTVNRLAVQLHAETFGEERARAIRLESSPPAGEVKDGIGDHGYVFGDTTWQDLALALRAGRNIVATTVAEESSADDLPTLLGEEAIPLLMIVDGMPMTWLPGQKRPGLPAGKIPARAVLIYLS